MLKNQKGLTLIELLVTLGLISFVIGVINQVYITQFQSFKIVEEKSKLTKEAKEIQNIITNIAMESSEVEVKENNDRKEIVFKSSKGKLDTFIYYRSLYTLLLNEKCISEKINEFSVHSLDRTDKEEKAINIKIKLKSHKLKREIEYETEFTVSFRNK